MKIQRILAIDYGLRRIGVAIGFVEMSMTFPKDHIDQKQEHDIFKAILKKLNEFDSQAIVVGYPQRTDGKPSEMANNVKKFVEELKAHTSLPIFLQDEAFSSQAAEAKTSHFSKKKKQKQKGKVDSGAAAIFLQEFLETRLNELEG